MIDLYEPSMSERGLQVSLQSSGPVEISADAALIHRMVANLLDNELKHLPPSCTLTIELRTEDDAANLILEDDGPGFDSDVLPHLFERRVKGRIQWALAFVDAVAAQVAPRPQIVKAAGLALPSRFHSIRRRVIAP